MMTEAGLAQTEATYYNICTAVLDLKEQINQVEEQPCIVTWLIHLIPYKEVNWKTSNCRNISQ